MALTWPICKWLSRPSSTKQTLKMVLTLSAMWFRRRIFSIIMYILNKCIEKRHLLYFRLVSSESGHTVSYVCTYVYVKRVRDVCTSAPASCSRAIANQKTHLCTHSFISFQFNPYGTHKHHQESGRKTWHVYSILWRISSRAGTHL